MASGGVMNGLPYYKAYPRDFIEGTIGMPFEMKCAYRVVLDLIYMQGGNLPDDARYISGLLGCSIRKWNSIRNFLIEADKIQASGDFLTNYRAEKELETLAKLQDKQRENRARPNKNKGLQKPRTDQPEPEPDTYTGTNVPDGVAVDVTEVIWTKCKDWLVSCGQSDANARKMIGLWLKDNSPETVRNAFKETWAAKTQDPVPYITAILKPKKAGPSADQISAVLSRALKGKTA